MLKGPKKSFVVVVLVLGVKKLVKNALNGTKNVRKQNLLQIEQKICKGTKNVLLWHIMVSNCRVCLVWACVAFCGLLWPCLVLFGIV